MKDLSLSLLLDLYGELLNEKQRRILSDYYNEDLSLSEISDNEGMSRQAVHETVKRVEQMLLCFEEKLHLRQTADALKAAKQCGDTAEIFRIIDSL